MGLTKAVSGNILVQNYGRNPAVNFNFMLRVEAIYDLPCRAVRVFQRENEYELIQEGGLNDYVHMRRKPVSKPFTFQVERYVGTDILDPLSNGTELILPVILYISQYGIYNGPFVPIRMYTFTGCTVMAKEYGELNAEKSGLLIETTTIAYREMICLENVAASFLQGDSRESDSTSKEGKEVRGVASPPKGKRPNARLWPKTASAQTPPKGENPKVRLWPKTASAQTPPKGENPKVRLWPETTSAQTPPRGENPKVRLWPETASAQTPPRGENPKVRLWPETASAQTPPKGENPKVRLWQFDKTKKQERSAVDVAAFLADNRRK